MIFTYFGIILFLIWEPVKFIKESPVKQAIKLISMGFLMLVSGRGILSSFSPDMTRYCG